MNGLPLELGELTFRMFRKSGRNACTLLAQVISQLSTAGHASFDKNQIPLGHTSFPKLRAESRSRLRGACKHDKTGRRPIKPMDQAEVRLAGLIEPSRHILATDGQ